LQKRIASVCLSVGLFVLLLMSSASGSVILDTGNIQVELSADRCWTMLTLRRAGSWYCDAPGSGQGTVVMIDGLGWAGSIHGNETLLDAAVTVDGHQAAVINGTRYAGNEIVFTRRTVLGQAYDLESILRVSADQIRESVTLTGKDAGKSSSFIYGFLGSRSNRLTDYAAFDAAGATLEIGRTIDGSGIVTSLPKTATSVAQYDPAAGNGILSIVTEGASWGVREFIWDRPTDNKLYSRFMGAEGPASPSLLVRLEERLSFFSATPQNWVAKAAEYIAAPGDFDGDGDVDTTDVNLLFEAIRAPQPPPNTRFDMTGDGLLNQSDADYLFNNVLHTSRADTNLDRMVDVLDLGNLANKFDNPGSFADGDADGSGFLDIVDLGIMAGDYGRDYRTVSAVGHPLPEPGSLLLLAAGLSGMPRRLARPRARAK
jgi:hypothetical protein